MQRECYHRDERRKPKGDTMRDVMQISATQLAELLIGIARAQASVVHGLESEFAGVRSGRIIPAVQNSAHLRDHPEPTLVDLPVRMLLTSMGRIPPDPAVIARDLERLISGVASAPATKDEAAAASAPAARAETAPVVAADGGDTLDFIKPS
jgi:hypothetical protein